MTSEKAPTRLATQVRAYMARLWPYFGRARGAWALAVVATLLASATEPMIPALLKPLLDRGFQGEGRVPLWQVPALLVLVFGLRAGASFLAQYGLAHVVHQGLQRLRDALFDKLLRADLSLFDTHSASALANTVVHEVHTGAGMLINSLVRLVRDAFTLVALSAYLLYLNWKLTLVVALIVPPLVLVVRGLSRRMYRITRQTQSATDDLAYVVEENVLAFRDIRLHAAQPSQAGRFGRLSNMLRQLSMKTVVAHAGMSAITQILSALALSAVVAVAIVQSAAGQTTVGGFVAFITAMLLLITPLKSLADVANPITRGVAALDRALTLMDQVMNEKSGEFTKPRAQGELRLKGVGVRYASKPQPALQAANLMDFVRQQSEGIHASVGHNGQRLSGGQRQRLAIARAIYQRAPVLILDEATSALDSESERLVQSALERLMQGRTSIVIAHRLSTIERADRIVALEAGRVAEQGSHAELLAAGGLYARLHALQFRSPA